MLVSGLVQSRTNALKRPNKSWRKLAIKCKNYRALRNALKERDALKMCSRLEICVGVFLTANGSNIAECVARCAQSLSLPLCRGVRVVVRSARIGTGPLLCTLACYVLVVIVWGCAAQRRRIAQRSAAHRWPSVAQHDSAAGCFGNTVCGFPTTATSTMRWPLQTLLRAYGNSATV